MKLTFTYLVRQDKKTWEDFAKSIFLLEKNILSKLNCLFDILIFCEGQPPKKVKDLIEFLKAKKSIEINLKLISLKDYVKRSNKKNYIKHFPHAARCDLDTSLGYRDMCKFFSMDVFNDENLVNSNYFIRIDTDSFFLDVRDIFIDQIHKLDCDYAYLENTDQIEDKAVTVGFGKCLYEYCKKNSKNKFLSENYFEICNEATLQPKLFYTNFEVVNLNWAKSQNHKSLIKHIFSFEGIYNYRWGDSIIRYYSVKLLKANVKILSGCLYKHSGLYDSRNKVRKLTAKIYSKLNNKLHKNNFEEILLRLDKFFLGIKNN